MTENFTSECLQITVGRLAEDNIHLGVSSDYSGSQRKSQLYVNEKNLAEQLERFWKSIKTKKLIGIEARFGEIDYYDNMVDVYETPIATIRRGLKKARIGHSTHGCIPKDWSFDLNCRLNDTTTSTPILEVVKKALGYRFTDKHEKEFRIVLKLFLQKKTKNIYFEI